MKASTRNTRDSPKETPRGSRELYDKEIVSEDTLIVRFHEPVRAASTTVIGGGLGELSNIVFHRVDKSFNEPYPGSYARKLLSKLNLPRETTAVFLTAVDVVKKHVEVSIGEPVKAWLIATIGLSPPACIELTGSKKTYTQSLGTINILVIVDRVLSDNALLDLLSLVSSTKTLALVDLGLSCSHNTSRAFSTITDATIIASRQGEGDSWEESYGGPATITGSTISKLVYNTIINHAIAERKLEERFQDVFTVNIDWIISRALEIYERAPIPGVGLKEVEEAVREELETLLADPNIWALGYAARNLDYHGLAGVIPGLDRREYIQDSKKIIADELLGITLSLYINGWKALFSYYWIDRFKDSLEGFKDKPMFIDDLLGSLIGSILSRIYDRYLPRR